MTSKKRFSTLNPTAKPCLIAKLNYVYKICILLSDLNNKIVAYLVIFRILLNKLSVP